MTEFGDVCSDPFPTGSKDRILVDVTIFWNKLLIWLMLSIDATSHLRGVSSCIISLHMIGGSRFILSL